MIGSIALKPLPFVLKEIHQELASGELVIKNRDEHRQIYFSNGNIAHISSSHSSDRLGLYLLKENLIDEIKLKEALNLYREGTLFGEFLVSLNLITPENLAESLKSYQAYLLSKILFWEDGAFIFMEKQFPQDKRFLDINFANLIIKSSRFLEDEVKLRKFFGEERHFICFSSNPVSLLQNLSLNSEEYFVLSRIEGIISLQELISISSVPRLKVLQTVFSLYISGVLDLLKREEAMERQLDFKHISKGILNVVIETQKELENKIPENIKAKRDFILNLKERAKEGDFYKIFNISPGATIQDIYQRYLEYIKIIHPDNSFEPALKDLREDMIELTQLLSKGYQILCNPQSKSTYDGIYKKSDLSSKEIIERKMVQMEIARKNFEKAKEYLDREDYHSALKLLEEAHRFDPENSEILLALVNIEVKNPNWIKRASDRLLEYLKDRPEFEDGWLTLATLYLSRGMVHKAKMCLEKVMQMNENNEKAKSLLQELQKKETKK
ncbi:MAG: DUF4388 domain-containing protein [Thermoanaerobaculia bacterium]